MTTEAMVIIRRRSLMRADRRRRIAAVSLAATALLASCGQEDDGEPFSTGRACRNVERLIGAIGSGDEDLAGDELDRLTDVDEVDARIDADELDDIVDDPSGNIAEDVEDAVADLDCDLDVDDIEITDPTTEPTEPTEPTVVSEPTVSTGPTDPTVTDPTSTSSRAPPFTLPPAPTTPTVPPTVPPTVTTTEATNPGPSPTTESTSASTDRRRPQPLIAVDVAAVDSDDVGSYDPRGVDEVVTLFGLDGLMVPAGPNEIDLVYVAHDFGRDPSRYDNFGFRFASELSEREVLTRFRDAVSEQGQYTFDDSDIADSIGFNAVPTAIDAQIPNWDVHVSPKEGRVHRVEIVRADYSDGVRTQMRDIVVEQRRKQLAVLDELGWDVSGFSYYSATDASASVYETSDFTFLTSDALVEAKDRLVGELGPNAETTEEDDRFDIDTPDGLWNLADYGLGVTGRFSAS